MQAASSADVRVAVIGSGLAGLATAHYLALAPIDKGKRVHVDIIEKNSSLGMDSESISIDQGGKLVRIDVPMRSFSEGYYPELIQLYRSLGIEFTRSKFSFAFSSLPLMEGSPQLEHGPNPEILYNGRSDGRGLSVYPEEMSLRSRFRAAFYLLTIILSYILLNILAIFHSKRQHTTNYSSSLSQLTFREWYEKTWISQRFLGDMLCPLLSSVMTTNLKTIDSLPAAELLEYIARSFLSKHYTVENGVQNVVRALVQRVPADHIHLGATILDLVPETDVHGTQRIRVRAEKQDGCELDLPAYEHVIFATQCTQSARLIQQYSAHLGNDQRQDQLRCQAMIEQLSEMQYEKSTVVCHTDTKILPKNPNWWRDLNFVSPKQGEKSSRYTMASHILRRGQKEATTFMQTTNPLHSLYPDPQTWISNSTFERFILTLRGDKARRHFFQRTSNKVNCRARNKDHSVLNLGPLQGRPASSHNGDQPYPGLWLTGSWSFGVPLLEGMS
ncbi:hypothetical protein MPSI1_002813 [Malassezia psittaci]|uniref:Amine oxidase domain-containing protein n=1 Tax=Malassezia psittaci TaxID=1821823 RepID=A0AAF0FBD5_9BASI|nr:hypothetical protein MPSI1_002813 [Malassezia psittaci]